MAVLSILLGRKTQPKIQDIELDATINESHMYQNQVTNFPVEDDLSISDHIIKLPDRVIITGHVTNAPIDYLGKLQAIKSSPVGRILGADKTRTNIAFDELRKLLKGYWNSLTNKYEHELVDIVTGLNTYKQMAFVRMTIPRNAALGESLRFTAEFKEIKKVSSQNTIIGNLKQTGAGGGRGKNGVANKGIPKQNNGKQTPQTSSVETQAKLKSSAAGLFDRVFK